MAVINECADELWQVVAYNPKERDAMLDNQLYPGIIEFDDSKHETRAYFANHQSALIFFKTITAEAYQGDHPFVR